MNRKSVVKRLRKEKKICELPLSELPRSSSFDELILVCELIDSGEEITPGKIGRSSLDGLRHVYCTLKSIGLLVDEKKATRLMENINSKSTKDEKISELAVIISRSSWVKKMLQHWNIQRISDLTNYSTYEFLEQVSYGAKSSKKGTASNIDSLLRQAIEFNPSIDSAEHPDVMPWNQMQRLEHQPLSIFEPNKLIPEIKKIASGSKFVRQGTGYISITGYDMIARMLEQAEMRLLVGSNDKRGRMEIANAVNTLKYSLENGPVSKFKINAAKRMRRELMSGGFRVRCLKARHTPDFHAKVQIYDASAVISGSANLSYNGLVKNIETCNILVDESTVKYYVENFDNYFLEAIPIESELLEILDDSWAIQSDELVDPRDAYLRILLEMYGDSDSDNMITDLSLADYQEFSVNKSVRDLIESKGSLLVAPTGTGKTIMGTVIARRMFQKNKISRVFVISPNDQIMDIWEKEFLKFRIPFQGIKRSLFREQLGDWEDRLKQLIQSINEDDLIIIDECHHFRNDGSGRTNLSKFLGEINQKSPYRLLLTATPISKGLGDLNNLLDFVNDKAHARRALDVATLPSVTYLTHPLIAQKFAKESKTGHKYVEFSGQQRFFAKKKTSQVKYDSEVLDRALEILRSMPLEQKNELPQGQMTIDGSSRFNSGTRDELSRVHLHRSFESSPRQAISAIDMMLEKNLEKKYFEGKVLRDKLNQSKKIFQGQKTNDSKLISCLSFISPSIERNEKILIFCNYKSTIGYLKDRINEKFPWINIATLTGDNSKNQKNEICDRFSPIYRNLKARKSDPQILIATDCLSEGVDLPDAHLMVNYDLFWTPLSLVQRVGRLDRPTNKKREFEVANMIPKGTSFNDFFGLVSRLSDRGEQYRKMAGIDVIRDNIRDLDELDNDQIEHLKALVSENPDDAFDNYVDQFSTKVLAQLATATESDKKRALSLPLGSASAYKSDDGSVGIVCIVRDKENYPHVLFEHKKEGWDGMKMKFNDQGDAIAHLYPEENTKPTKIPKIFFRKHESLLRELALKYNCELEDLTPVINLIADSN